MRNLSALSPRWRIFSEPFEVLLGMAALLSGVPVAWGATRPESLVAHLTPWAVRGWGAMLCAGGIVTLISRFRMGRARTDAGLIAASRLEVIGMVLFVAVLGVYAAAVLMLGSRGLAVGPMAAAWASAFAIRARIVTRQIAELDIVLRAGPGDG